MSDYALTISDAEIRRYLSMAERARESEADLWAMAGIVLVPDHDAAAGHPAAAVGRTRGHARRGSSDAGRHPTLVDSAGSPRCRGSEADVVHPAVRRNWPQALARPRKWS